MTLFYFILFSIIYIIMTNLVLSTPRDFDFFETVLLFIFGAVVGYAVDSYLAGYVIAVVLNLLYWGRDPE